MSKATTHTKLARGTHRFLPGSNGIPQKIVILDGSGSVSLDVLRWLSEQGVPLVRSDWRGEVVAVCAILG